MAERDIVDDLREGATVLDEPYHCEAIAQTMLRAADEIERLRKWERECHPLIEFLTGSPELCESPVDYAKELYAEIARLRSEPPTEAGEQERYFLARDHSAHWCLVPVSIRDDWNTWLEIPEDDERAWTLPEGARMVGGAPSLITFTDPREGA